VALLAVVLLARADSGASTCTATHSQLTETCPSTEFTECRKTESCSSCIGGLAEVLECTCSKAWVISEDGEEVPGCNVTDPETNEFDNIAFKAYFHANATNETNAEGSEVDLDGSAIITDQESAYEKYINERADAIEATGRERRLRKQSLIKKSTSDTSRRLLSTAKAHATVKNGAVDVAITSNCDAAFSDWQELCESTDDASCKSSLQDLKQNCPNHSQLQAATAATKSTHKCKSASTAPNGKLPDFSTPCCHQDGLTNATLKDLKDTLKKNIKTAVDWGGCKHDIEVEIQPLSVFPDRLGLTESTYQHKTTKKKRVTRGGNTNVLENDDDWKLLYRTYNEASKDAFWNANTGQLCYAHTCGQSKHTLNLLWSRVKISRRMSGSENNNVPAKAMNIYVTACGNDAAKGTKRMARMAIAKLTYGSDPTMAAWAVVPPITGELENPAICTGDIATGTHPGCVKQSGNKPYWPAICGGGPLSDKFRPNDEDLCKRHHYEFYNNFDMVLRKTLAELRFRKAKHIIQDKITRRRRNDNCQV